MSALARYFNHQGYKVAGYDRTPSSLTDALQHEGIAVHFEDSVDAIPAAFKEHPKSVNVIYTPAVPSTSIEFQYLKQQGYPMVKRSAALGLVAQHKTCLAVAGTHGKTTTSTLLAHLLTQALGDCTAFLGGISKNYDTNLLLSKNEWLVAEADEYDRSFLQLFPQAAVITSTDADHLDIYGSVEEVKKSFAQFAAQVRPGGTLIVKKGVDLVLPQTGCTVYRYSLDIPCDFYASDIRLLTGGYYLFNLHTPHEIMEDCTLGIPGRINVENAIAAMTLALVTGADRGKLKEALASFKGVKRRFDFYLNTPRKVYLDDYAHHPEELRASITSIRAMFPGRTITGIFQPHLYSRTRDFASEFAQSLNLLDSLILLDIYPARELPIAGVTSDLIFNQVTIEDKTKCTRDQVLSVLEHKTTDVVVTFGAGDIDRLTGSIADLLNVKN